MKTNFLILALISGLAVQLGCGGKKTESSDSSGRSVPASVITVRYASVPAIVEAPGTVQSRNRIALSSQINGFVREISVRVGDSVRQGQILATLDARDADSQKAMAQGAVDEAQAALSEARKTYQAAVEKNAAAKSAMDLAGQTYLRYQKLYESRSVSPQEMDEVKMRRDASAAELASGESMVAAAQERIKQAEARIAQAKAQSGRADVLLGYTQIKAPSPGRIVEKTVDAGTALFPGTPLMTIESTSRPQVLADIPTEHAQRLQSGMTVHLKNSLTQNPLEGRIVEIVPLSNPATHSVQFKVDLPADAAVPNGQFLKVEIPIGTRNVILVPQQAIRETGQLTGLFVVDSASKARFRLVKTLPYDTAQYEVLAGIEPGEKVLARLSDEITDGTTVEMRP
ncbi:MAG TPA: efflux RND transporter periplasmic adaptor subunit [Acidobacteriota bacterium]|nr:efflux RND transporter periplasmic adaptor subunit [Acidobacteriota bacterium]